MFPPELDLIQALLDNPTRALGLARNKDAMARLLRDCRLNHHAVAGGWGSELRECPLLRPRLPPAAADESERPRLVGTGPGIKLLSSPSEPTELRQRAMPGSGSVSHWRSQHVAMPDGPTPQALSTAAEGA